MKKIAKTLKTDTEYKAVEFIETYTGRAFYPLHPDPATVDIIHIAHALSNQCRYCGAFDFYSTAQHCCLLADYTAAILKGTSLDCLQILMHDAAEAYLVDIPRPVKQHMPDYRVWDHDINDAIRAWLCWDDVMMPPFQDEIDSRIIVDERAHLTHRSGLDWQHDLPPLGITIKPWSPLWAEQQFLLRYITFSAAVYGCDQYVRDKWSSEPRLRASWHETASDDRGIEDVIEVDIRGGVGRVKVRTPDGMLARDPAGGEWPRASWRWVYGNFTLEKAA